MANFFANTDRHFLNKDNVTVSGTYGDAGSSLTFDINTLFQQSPRSGGITDFDEDSKLDAGIDGFGASSGDVAHFFTGYTFAFGGKTWPLFGSPDIGFWTFGDGVVDFTPGSSFNVTTNLYQDEALTSITCFAAGTRITTPTGDCAVERLQPGDEIATLSGKTIAVKWVGRQTVFPYFDPAERLRLVRVKAGTFGVNVPQRDLFLTADHAIYLDGLLINAGALVNGSSIDVVPNETLAVSYTVYHIETDEHEIILAEGTPAETFIDYVGRHSFDNFEDYIALYGDAPTIVEMSYPRISTARLVPADLKARLAQSRAA